MENFLKKLLVKPVLPKKLQQGKVLWLDFADPVWADAASCSVVELIARTDRLMQQNNAVIAVGRYAEDRAMLYSRSALFVEGEELRSLHLGLDLTVPAQTPVATPLPAIVHSFADNTNFGDYGPTVILQHNVADETFYTLYGHLGRDCLSQLTEGKSLTPGESFAVVGDERENGCWPPHLHFQVIRDLQGYCGGYPGVVKPSEATWYLQNCPDPNSLLRLCES